MQAANDASAADAKSRLETWLALHTEAAIEPGLPIVDPHHHLRDYGRKEAPDCYLFDDLLRDVSSGHHVLATVVVECHNNMYRRSGPPELRSLGEIEFLTGIAAMFASGRYGETQACAAIVSFADLCLGERVDEILEMHFAAAGGRLRGIRNSVSWDASEVVRTSRLGPRHLLLDSAFRNGYSRLAARNLSFDAYVFHPQLPDVIDLARTFPETALIVNHCGGPLGIGPYAGNRDEIMAKWSAHLRTLGGCPNVFMKLGGLGSARAGFGFEQRSMPVSSTELAEAWRPYIETCIEIFGPERCMFESNFPPDKVSCSYAVLWNAFKRIASQYTAAQKNALFSQTAISAYRLDLR